MSSTAAALPLYQVIERHPLDAPYRAGLVERAVRASVDDGHALVQLGFNLGGVQLYRPASTLDELAQQLQQAPDPVSTALTKIAEAAGVGAPMTVDTSGLPVALRDEIAILLASIARAERYRQRALLHLPAALSAETLTRQAIDGQLRELETPDFRSAVTQVEYPALAAGMLDLVAATERMVRFLRTTPHLPPVNWQADTPLGRVVIDTADGDHHHPLDGSLLVIDAGGNDHYHATAATTTGISVLIDLAGDDCYQGAAGALMGYSIVWDVSGNDRHTACEPHTDLPRLAQAAALFGAALLVDEEGDDIYHATSHAQAWSLAGTALLIDHSGQDSYHALTFAQGSANTHGTALLLDSEGNDHYTLAAAPLKHPSSQLPDRNLSMGQGAGMGIRAVFTDGRSLPGGLGMLIDLAGNDRYHAQVFAQGAGYYQGIGLLIDGGGRDDYHAAWYGMGAAAHQGVGMLIDRASDNDRYEASHSTSMAAAHDRSAAFLIDEGGDDQYLLGHLGLGTAHDNGLAVFADLAGADRYELTASACLAFGGSHLNSSNDLRASLPNIGLFLDLGGTDHYPPHCAYPGNNQQWQWSRAETAGGHPAGYGGGLDGEHPSPITGIQRARNADQPSL